MFLLVAGCGAGGGLALGDDWGAVEARMKPFEGETVAGVDPSTLAGKVMCGYQGWFHCDGDGAGLGWIHYGRGEPKPGACTIDFWPDMSEMDEDEKFSTGFKHADGSTAHLFSSHHPKTVDRHFKWMEQYGIDGVFVQRFATSTRKPTRTMARNQVLDNCRTAANAHGRTWAVMYDLSGLKRSEIDSIVVEDWKRLVDHMKIRRDPMYLHHGGKPVVAVWGMGFKGRDYTLVECEALVSFLKNDATYGGNTVMLGVPTGWRELTRDCIADKTLHAIIQKADIVSPWTVGRYNSVSGAKKHAARYTGPDLAWCATHGKDYLPVVFPGFSWQNLKAMHGEKTRLDAIPRRKGDFLWAQYTACARAGATMVYQAMFDEVDEGTAIMKCSNNPPVGASKFVTYEGLPSDYYLRLVGKATRMIRKEIPVGQKPGTHP